jgi:DNA primase
VPLVAQIKEADKRDGYATKLAYWVGWTDVAMVVRRVRESAGAPEKAKAAQPSAKRAAASSNGEQQDGPARPHPSDPRLWAEREALKVALQEPALAGPYYDSMDHEVFTHPAYQELHAALLAAGGTSAGLSGPSFVDAVGEHCTHQSVRSLLTELAVEPLKTMEADGRYVNSVLARVQEANVARQIADVKSKLQRMSPMEDADNYRSLFGDLVALEQYRKALGEQAAGDLV